MRRMIAMMAFVWATCSAFGAETHLALDTRMGTRYARAEEPIAFSTEWDEGVTRLVLNVDGTNVLISTVATNGVYVWKPDLSTTRTVTLKHTTRGTINVVLETTFTTAAYDVTFAPGEHGTLDVGVPLVQRVPHGEAAVAPTVVPATGYRFTGWNANTTNVTSDVTATAQYEAISYAITYENLYGATHTNPATYTIEDAVTFTAPGSVPRRQFVCWEPAAIVEGMTGALTVRAVWDVTPYVYVNAETGDDAQDGSTVELAVKTLARAYALAEAGDVIIVAAGTYGPVTATGKSVTFRTAEGAVIDGGSTSRCVTADDEVVFENFTIQNGYDDDVGGGVKGGTYDGCIITNCVSEWDGGGAYEATLLNCTIVDNFAENGWGGGAYGGTLVNCVVKDNVAGDVGGGAYAFLRAENTTFCGNVPDNVAASSETVAEGDYLVYAPAGGAVVYSVPHSWFIAYGLANAGESTSGLSDKLEETYANGYTGWEAFVAGLTSTSQVFRAEITFDADGRPALNWSPNLNGDSDLRCYRASGRSQLGEGEWEHPIKGGHQFFKVEVAMPDGKTESDKPGLVPELGGVQLWENGPYWAECNVGATKPEEYGYYFWWGDTVGYTREGGTWTHASNVDYYADVTWVSSTGMRMTSSPFSFEMCPTFQKSESELRAAGYINETGALVAEHDAATVYLGAPWRMPTSTEFSKLVNYCDTTWTTRNGVYGRLITGRGAYASNSIFLPATGHGLDSRLIGPGAFGFYRASSKGGFIPDYSGILVFYSTEFNYGGNYRCYGQSVRPVRGFAQ